MQGAKRGSMSDRGRSRQRGSKKEGCMSVILALAPRSTDTLPRSVLLGTGKSRKLKNRFMYRSSFIVMSYRAFLCGNKRDFIFSEKKEKRLTLSNQG